MNSLDAATRFYHLAVDWQASSVLVEHATLERFSSAVGELLKEVGENVEDDYWASIARPLRAARWRLATIPLAVNSSAVGVQAAADLVVPRLRRCRFISPGLADRADALADQLEHLWACGDDPLGDAVRAALDSDDHGGILLTDGRSAEAVAASFGGHRVLTAAELMRTTFPHVVAAGPSAWFPRRILQAPRAERFTFAHFGWIRDREPDLGLIEGSGTMLWNGFRAPPARAERPEQPVVEALDFVPQFDWGAISRVAHRRSADAHGEPVSAQLFLLASGQGVFLETREGAKAIIAELEEGIVVKQMSVVDLSVGAYLVVRTEGDADYVRVYADQLLGARASHLRTLQTRIKRRLNAEIEDHGVALVARKLRWIGSPIASENNLRRWADPANIRTNDYADFAALCELIQESDPKSLWSAMGEIWTAHIRAGNAVRKLLVAELRNADTTGLLKDGWADYDVAEIEGEGALRVVRVTGRAPEPTDVPRSRLRKAFSIGNDLWLG